MKKSYSRYIYDSIIWLYLCFILRRSLHEETEEPAVVLSVDIVYQQSILGIVIDLICGREMIIDLT